MKSNKNKFTKEVIAEIIPSEKEISEHNKKEETWCKKEQKFVYDPKQRKHCSFCGGKLR